MALASYLMHLAVLIGPRNRLRAALEFLQAVLDILGFTGIVVFLEGELRCGGRRMTKAEPFPQKGLSIIW